MSLASFSLPANGDQAVVDPYNLAITALQTVVNGGIDSSNITDGSITVAKFAPGAVAAALNVPTTSSPDLIPLATVPTVTANNGNKENVLKFTGVNYTDRLGAGGKIRVTRATTPPTQSMAFTAASSQYATKASPTGITFLSAFTCEAWLYLNSYPGVSQSVEGRYSGTAGFQLEITGTGQVRTFYGNASSFTDFVSAQSIPLKKWVHVAAAVTSVSSKTAAIYINGTLVNSTSALTAATSMTQPTSDLRIGAYSGTANNYFDGYIAEARIWSTGLTQTQIQANMGINLVGTETNLVALFPGNGTFNDLTANANNLTAVNGASSTQASYPYNVNEWGIISKSVLSGSDTLVTVSTGNLCTIPMATVSNPVYATSENPLNAPNDLHGGVGRKLLYIPVNSGYSTTSSSITNPFIAASGLSFTVPQNVTSVKVKIFNVSSGNSSGTAVFTTFNGSTQVGQINVSTNTTGYLSTEIIVDVVPGSTFLFNQAFYASGGTTTWSQGSVGGSNAIWVEVA